MSAPAVAGVFRHHVDRDAAGHHLGRNPRREVVDLLEHPLVVIHHRRAAATARPVDCRAVDVEADVRSGRAVRRQPALLNRLRAPDVIGRDLDAGDQLRDRPRIAPGRDAFEDVLAHDRLLEVGSRIDGRRPAGHRDRFGDRADLELRIDRRDERGADPDVLVFDRPESGQIEFHAIRSGRQSIEPVVAVRVRRLRLDATDQPFARQGHHHARQDRAAGISHAAGNRPCLHLCFGRRGRR